MDSQRQGPSAPGKAEVKAVGAAGVFLLLGGLACLGLILVWVNFFADRFAVQAAADAYLSDLGAGRTKSAYERTTQQFQVEQSLPQFHRMVEKSPVLKRHSSWSYDRVNIYKGRGRLQGVVLLSVSGVEHPPSLTLHLVKEDGHWKVDKWYDTWD